MESKIDQISSDRNLENYFEHFRKNILGFDLEFETAFGKQKMVYADWIASGRLYKPIEEKMNQLFGPMVGNTHSEASETGVTMTQSYHIAQQIIKKHVNASKDDVLISTGSGMTGAINKFQRLLGLKIPEQTHNYCNVALAKYNKCLKELGENRPVVFITHMEHHSNHTSWLETVADVVIVEPDKNLMVSPENLRTEIEKYKNRPLLMGSFTAGSNVTGIRPTYYELAKIMHEFGGYCFIDFAATAPYDEINMHPINPMERLDAVFFSPHKFLGGPGSTGILIFNKELYKNTSPDQPGGGTVKWTNRWNEFQYVENIEAREDGGTPPFLQTIRVALAIKLKEKMGTKQMRAREKELLEIAIPKIRKIKGIHILADNKEDRIGVVSFYVEKIHHNLIVRLLNDRYGIQVRGGCSCAGTYGHYLLNVDLETSHAITCKINNGDLSEKPGWVRLSIHPTMTNAELEFIIEALNQVVENIDVFKDDYYFDKSMGEFFHKTFPRKPQSIIEQWFEL